MTALDFETLRALVSRDAAIRRRQVLQPVGGKGDKIFPPTYPGEGKNSPPPRHVYERRRIGDREVWCVLVDSVQSQANRLEDSLLEAIRSGKVQIPHLVVDFRDRKIEGISEVTSLDAPHRVYDAILRDSLLGGEPFMKSALGQRLAKAKAEDASVLVETSPTALLFGSWHSTGEGGGLGAKFARSLVSEIVAVDVPVDEFRKGNRSDELEVQTAGRRTGSRMDPMGVLRRVEVFKGPSGWDVSKEKAGKNAKLVKPSEINHGNIAPSVTPLGITCDYLEHTFVLSFAALRRLRFGSPEKDQVARVFLASIGILALIEQDARGYSLRSRCDLVCDGRRPLEIVHPDGSTDEIVLSAEQAVTLYKSALRSAGAAGFNLASEPIRLVPQDKLVDIVRKSQELALSGEGGEGEDGEADEK